MWVDQLPQGWGQYNLNPSDHEKVDDAAVDVSFEDKVKVQFGIYGLQILFWDVQDQVIRGGAECGSK
jgi:hypothetical protein